MVSYLHHVIYQDKKELFRTLSEQQLKERKPIYWAIIIWTNMEEFLLNLSFKEILNTPISQWKEPYEMQAIKKTLSYLNSKLGSKSQSYSEFKMSKYLCPYEHFSM